MHLDSTTHPSRLLHRGLVCLLMTGSTACSQPRDSTAVTETDGSQAHFTADSASSDLTESSPLSTNPSPSDGGPSRIDASTTRSNVPADGSRPTDAAILGDACTAAAPGDGARLEGDLTLTTADDVEAAAQYSVITGNLTFVGTQLADVDLPNLRTVGGDLTADSTSVTRLSLPNLTQIGGGLWFYLNFSLEGDLTKSLLAVDLRNLRRISGELYVHRNVYLSSLQVGALTDVGGMQVSGNLDLPWCYVEGVAALFDATPTGEREDCTCSVECGVVQAMCLE